VIAEGIVFVGPAGQAILFTPIAILGKLLLLPSNSRGVLGYVRHVDAGGFEAMVRMMGLGRKSGIANLIEVATTSI
jgi:hypothetical protein